MSIFPIPKGIIDKIPEIQRDFLWSGSNDRKSLPLLRREIVELPKALGGLSVGSLLNRNVALLFKWIWSFFNEPQALWMIVIQSNYKYPSSFSVLDLKVSNFSGPQQGICPSVVKQFESLVNRQTRYAKKYGRWT